MTLQTGPHQHRHVLLLPGPCQIRLAGRWRHTAQMRLALHFVTVTDSPITLWTLRRGTSVRECRAIFIRIHVQGQVLVNGTLITPSPSPRATR